MVEGDEVELVGVAALVDEVNAAGLSVEDMAGIL